jgi:hypothetical protein
VTSARRAVMAFFIGDVASAELAVDMTAEVFAEVVVSRERFDPRLGTGSAWLFGDRAQCASARAPRQARGLLKVEGVRH